MKICYVTTNFDQFRGGGEVLITAINELKTRHKITVFTAETNIKNPDFDLRILKIREWPYYYGLFDYFFTRKFIKEFSKVLKTEKFDLIHINRADGSPLCQLSKFNIPVICTIYHATTADLESALDFEKNPFKRLVWWLRYFPLIRAQKLVAKKLPHILTDSEAAAKKISDDYKISKEKISIIYNSINTDIFKPSAPKEKNTVLAAGSFIHPRKGFDFLLKIYKELDKKGIKILDVGRRPEYALAELAKLKNVQRFGVVSRESLLEFYSKATVHLSTSRYEGFGLSILEAMACGTPTIAFGVGGANEALGYIDPDLIVPFGDIDIMLKKIYSILDASEPLKVDLWRQKIEKNFGVKKILQELENFYYTVIKK